MATKRFQSTDQLAIELKRWAEERKIVSDPYLNNLIRDLENRENLHIWAELSPIDFLPHPTSEMRSRQQELVRVITVIRNILVFAPVALTWASVGAATTGFAAYIKANGANVVNFLDFWQNGYGFLASHWKIAEVARLDFAMILIVIACTFYVSLVGHSIQRTRNQEEFLIDQERMQVALNIAHTLSDKRKVTSLNMSQAVAGSISRLVSATKALEDTAKAVNKLKK